LAAGAAFFADLSAALALGAGFLSAMGALYFPARRVPALLTTT
jgi:hypothetical protein